MTPEQKELKAKHGTPEEFNRALLRAAMQFTITPKEGEAALEKYRQEWRKAGLRKATIAEDFGGKFSQWKLGEAVLVHPEDEHGFMVEREVWDGPLPLLNQCYDVPASALKFSDESTQQNIKLQEPAS